MGRAEELTAEEQRLRVFVGVIGLLSAVFVVTYVATAVTYSSRYPFVANSITKDVLFGALCVLGVSDIRRFAYTAVLLAIAHVVLVVGLALVIAFGDTSTVTGTLNPSALPLSAGGLVWVWLGADVVIAAVLLVLYDHAQRARYGLRYVSSVEFSTLMAMAEILTPDDKRRVPCLDVAKRVDNYLAAFSAQGKWKVRIALVGLSIYPLLTLRPPFSMMNAGSRERFVHKRFLSDIWARRVPGFLRTPIQAMIRAAQQLAFLGYYEDPRAAEECGYVPFSERDGYEDLLKTVDWQRRRVKCLPPHGVGRQRTADVAIVGSGAAGSILAYELARQGREVLILERGPHVDPSEFTEVESHQLSRLYSDGALTLSRDFRFQILQGMCVGGSTVVNNGVCFDIPDRALDVWQDPDGLDAGLDPADLRHSFAEVRKLLSVRRLTAADPLNPGGAKFTQGVANLGLTAPPYAYDFFDCNIDDCLGCGYCNIGCKFGKKLSMLERVLPEAQRQFGDAVQILADCEVKRVETGGGRALALDCRLDGTKLRVRANRIVLSAGAVASSMILARSGLGGKLVGRHLGFNAGSAVTAEFDEPLHSERGLQMTNYVVAPDGQDYALETWFNPLASQSLFMPGWFEQHYENMLRYPHMTSVGAVVGTRRNATVKPQPVIGGVSLDYVPDPHDFQRILAGAKMAARIMLAAGAKRVMPASFRYLEARCTAELDAWDAALRDNSDVSISTSHPQGGNCLSRDRRKGVVDPDFRVHDIANLYVCDASVFPSPITVNPQLTVMALAHYAARRIAAAPRMPAAPQSAGPRVTKAPQKVGA